MKARGINVQGIKFRINLDPSSEQICQRRIYHKGMWEPWITKFVLTHLKREMVFVDVGASVGWFSLLVAASSPKRKVIAYEPDKKRYSMLQLSRAMNRLENLTVHNSALMDVDGEVALGGRAHAQISEGTGVVAETMDSSIGDGKVDMVKIDVEGAELRTLKGMSRIIENNPHIIILVEVHGRLMKRFKDTQEELFEYMEGRGFSKIRLHSRYWVFKK